MYAKLYIDRGELYVLDGAGAEILVFRSINWRADDRWDRFSQAVKLYGVVEVAVGRFDGPAVPAFEDVAVPDYVPAQAEGEDLRNLTK